ncbi:MAG: hypothetical protein AAF991_04420 [Pseudomonadota bacterium]
MSLRDSFATSIRYSDSRQTLARGDRAAVGVRRTDRRDFQWLLALSVLLFLLVSVLTRWLPRSLRPLAGPKGSGESCLAEAKRAANAVVPYAFEW